MGFRFNMVESRMLDFLLASLEVIRRGHWNFYRYMLFQSLLRKVYEKSFVVSRGKISIF
jgi:hypothetical protein